QLWQWPQLTALPSPPSLGLRDHPVFSPDGSKLAYSESPAAGMTRVAIWDVHAGQPCADANSPKGYDALCYSRRGILLAFAFRRHGFSLWNAENGGEIDIWSEVPQAEIMGSMVLVRGRDSWRICDTETGTELATLPGSHWSVEPEMATRDVRV